MPMRCASSSRWYVASPRRISERLGALEVQVRVVLPREADATVDLDVLGRGVEVRVGAVRLRQRGDHRQLVVVLGRGPRRVVRGRLRRLDLEQHVGALVLDRLERADRPAELHADLRVLDRHLEHDLRAAHHLVGERDRGLVERLARTRPSPRPASPSGVGLRRRRTRASPACGSGPSSRARVRVRPVGVTATVKNEMPSVAARARGARHDDDEVGDVAVDHEHLLPSSV